MHFHFLLDSKHGGQKRDDGNFHPDGELIGQIKKILYKTILETCLIIPFYLQTAMAQAATGTRIEMIRKGGIGTGTG